MLKKIMMVVVVSAIVGWIVGAILGSIACAINARSIDIGSFANNRTWEYDPAIYSWDDVHTWDNQ